MSNPSMTPEEKLLRIIETPQEMGRGTGMRGRKRGVDFSLYIKFFKAKYIGQAKVLFNIKSLNVALVVVSLCLTVFLGLDFWMGLPRLNIIQKLEALAKKTAIADIKTDSLEPLIIYLQEIGDHNMFGLAEKAPAAPVSAQKSEAVSALKNLADGLKVVGILWSEAPQAIVEDTKDGGRTYLLNRGAIIKTARVKDILKDRVILGYDDQEVEII